MIKNNWFYTLLLSTLTWGCGTGNAPIGPGPGGNPSGLVVEVDADITADTHWTADKTYALRRHIFVEAGVLTIDAGTTILGDQGSSLVITQNARISAVGTAQKPIVFTSSRDVGTRKPGDWGGVVLLGRSTVNEPSQLRIEGFPDSEMRTTYGGSDPTHNCGTFKYARIEFAGFELQPNKELNGLSVGACGSDTIIDYVQVHRGSDDGVEMFGGTANLKHIVVTQVDDDGLDWDYGWTAKAQFIIVQQSKNAGDCGIEADNHPDPNHNAMPIATPTIYNISLIGSGADPQGGAAAAYKRQTGILFRRGTAGRIENMLMAHFADFPIDVTNPDTVAHTQAPMLDLYVKNSLFFSNGNQASWDDPMDLKDQNLNEGMLFAAEPTNAPMVGVDPMLSAALDLTAPRFKPMTASPLMNAAASAVPPSDGFFDATARFVGAVGAEDWTTGWTAYPEN